MATEESEDELDLQKLRHAVGETPIEELEEVPAEELLDHEEVEDVDRAATDNNKAVSGVIPVRSEHLGSMVSATTATTSDYDDEYDDSATQPTPSSTPKQRIVELGRGDNVSEDEPLEEAELVEEEPYEDIETSDVKEPFEEIEETLQEPIEEEPEEVLEELHEVVTEDHPHLVDEHPYHDDQSQEEFVDEEEEAWEELPVYASRSAHDGDIDAEEKDEPIQYNRKVASDVDSIAKGSIDRFEKEEQSEPYKRDRTTTQEGWVAVRLGPNEWQERYAVIQPAFGVFAFDDDIAAQDWRRVETKSSYDTRLLLACDGLHMTHDGNLAEEAEAATAGVYSYAVTLSNDRSVLSVIAFSETSKTEWLNALEGARSVADYLTACEHLNVAPIPSLLRLALSKPPLKVIELRKYDLSDLDVLESVCQLAVSSGQSLLSLRLEQCALTEEGALLLRECLLRLSNLQELDLSDNDDLGEVGSSAIFSGIPKNRLRILGLSNCEIGDGAGIELADVVARSPTLTRLDVSKNRLTPMSGLRLASALAHCSQIESISLGSNIDLQDEMVNALVSSFPAMHLLRELDLSNIRMTDWGLARLERAFSENPVITTSFECLDLRDNHLLSLSALQGLTERVQFIRGVILLPSADPFQRSMIYDAADVSLNSLNSSGLQAEKDNSSYIRVVFSGEPVPAPDRLKGVLCGLLGISPSRMQIQPPDANMESLISICNDADGVDAERLIALQGEPKLRLLRVAHFQRKAAAPIIDEHALVKVTNRDEETIVQSHEAVPLEVLSASVSDTLLEGQSSLRLQRDLQATADTLSPLSRTSLTLACEGRLNKASICAACGLVTDCEASVANEAEASGQLDVVSLVQSAAVNGDVTRLRQYVLRAMDFSEDSDQARTGFARRLADILVRASPIKVAPENPLSMFPRLRDTFTRPLTISLGMDEAEFKQGCERVFQLVQIVLGYEQRPDHDVDGSGAFSELLGIVLRSPDLGAELHIDLALRTCLNESSRPTKATWVLAVLALRCAPIRREIDAQLGMALSAAYKRYYDRTKEPMAMQALRAIDSALFPHSEITNSTASAVLSHPLKRLDYIKRTFRRQAASITVSLPDGRGIIVDSSPFSTLLDTLIMVDKHLVRSAGHSKEFATAHSLQTRWSGFHFVETDGKQFRVLHMGDDPHWWHFRTNKELKLVLKPIVALSAFPALSEADASCPDEHIRGDHIRLAQVFAQEKHLVGRQIPSTKYTDVQAVAYITILAVVEELGEEKFRSTSLGEVFRKCESMFTWAAEGEGSSTEAIEHAANFKNHIESFQAELLSTPRGSLTRDCLRAAFVNYAHVWPLSGALAFNVIPKQSCNGGTVLDGLSLPKEAVLTVSLRNGISLLMKPKASHDAFVEVLDTRSVLWSCDLRSLARVDDKLKPKEIRFTASGEEDWLVCEFPTAAMAEGFKQIILFNIWAILAHGGAILPTQRWLEEYSFRFPHLPLPPSPPKLAIPPGGLLRTVLNRSEMETRLAASIITDYLLRPFANNKRQEIGLVPRAFYFGPVELSDVVLTNAANAGTLDNEEAALALPPLAPPPPQGTPTEVEFPLPLGPPPPQDDEDAFLAATILPPRYPPPPDLPPLPPSAELPSIPPPTSSPPPVSESTERALPAVAAPAPVGEVAMQIAETAQPAQQPEESEEERKARLKREFLRKKREREEQQEELL